MKIAITGGTGFVGGHLAEVLCAEGHALVLVARGVDPHFEERRKLSGATFERASVDDEESLVAAFEGCHAVVHCAGINRQIGTQTYETVHVQGTRNVVSAAKRAGVRRLATLSYLRARLQCGSGYLESKWEAEEIVRSSGLDHLVVKAGMIYGSGDHMLDHLAKALGTFPFFVRIGFTERDVRPVAIEDVVCVLRAFVVDDRLTDETVAVVGPEPMGLAESVSRVAAAMGLRRRFVPMPIPLLYVLAWVAERVMKVPLVSIAQVRLLREEAEPGPLAGELPRDLRPQSTLDEERIRRGLPERRRYGLADLRWFPMNRIRLETLVPASPECCFDLCRTVEVHLTTPGSKERAVHGVRNGLMDLGDSVTWESSRLGVRVQMTSKITEFDRPRRFVDEMQRGPFRAWRHEHRFEEVGLGTRMLDEIAFASPLGALGWMADRLFVRRYMRRLVRRQNEHIAKIAEGHSPEEED